MVKHQDEPLTIPILVYWIRSLPVSLEKGGDTDDGEVLSHAEPERESEREREMDTIKYMLRCGRITTNDVHISMSGYLSAFAHCISLGPGPSQW